MQQPQTVKCFYNCFFSLYNVSSVLKHSGYFCRKEQRNHFHWCYLSWAKHPLLSLWPSWHMTSMILLIWLLLWTISHIGLSLCDRMGQHKTAAFNRIIRIIGVVKYQWSWRLLTQSVALSQPPLRIWKSHWQIKCVSPVGKWRRGGN